ncbi:MAG: hypothetical protein P8Y95_02990 [Gammaproteobacteria bacterium]|jgi:hypothetical protein
MTKLVYTEEELFRDRDDLTPQTIGGRRLHGGFDPEGTYHPPRSLVRNEAIEEWTEALRAAGGELLDADASLLRGPNVPNVAQQCLLIREGLGQTFWNNLTTTGKIEGRGRMLAEMQFPDLQPLVVEDISEMGIGHLNKGLLKAHGWDEGGQPELGIGGHDVMWFVVRDLAFGDVGYPDIEPPGTIARDQPDRLMPDLPEPYERLISFLMNLLIIEFRAEIGFGNTQKILRTPDVFADRREEAEEAAEIVERIRSDEEIHVLSLRLYLGELRNVHLRTVDGREVLGAEIIDPFWEGLVQWATVERPRLMAQQQYEMIKARILEHSEGERILEAFDALSDLKQAA